MLGFKSILIILSFASIVSSKFNSNFDDVIVATLEKELDNLLEQTLLNDFQNSEFDSKLSVDPFETFSTFENENENLNRKPNLFGSKLSKDEKLHPELKIDESEKSASSRESRIRSGRSTCAGGGVGKCIFETEPNCKGEVPWSNQGKLIQGKAQIVLKNWKNLFGDQREDS